MSSRQKIIVVVLLILYLLPIWIYPLFPSQDGPSHLYNTVLFRDLLGNPNDFFARFYQINWRPFSNWTFTILASLFYPALSILTAEKIVLSLYLVGFVLSMFYFLRSIHAQKTVLGFAGFLFCLNWSLLMGFYNFCLSIPILLWTVGYCLRHRGVIRGARMALVTCQLLALYFSHIVTFGIGLLVLTFLFGCYGQKKLRALVELAVCAAPSLVLYAANTFLPPHVPSAMYYAPWGWRLGNAFNLRICPGLNGMEIVWYVTLWAVLACWLVQTLRQPRCIAPEERPWWFVVVGLVVLSMSLPYAFAGGSALNERFGIFIGIFLIAALPVRGWKPPQSWLAAACGVLVVAQLVVIHVSFATWNARLLPFVHVTAHVDRFQRVLPVLFEDHSVGFFVNPYLHADSYVLMRTHSVSPTNYEGFREYFPVAYRKNAFRAEDGDMFEPETFLDRDMARDYDEVLLWRARDAILRHPALRGFHPVWSEGDLRLFKRR